MTTWREVLLHYTISKSLPLFISKWDKREGNVKEGEGRLTSSSSSSSLLISVVGDINIDGFKAAPPPTVFTLLTTAKQINISQSCYSQLHIFLSLFQYLGTLAGPHAIFFLCLCASIKVSRRSSVSLCIKADTHGYPMNKSIYFICIYTCTYMYSMREFLF